MGGSRQKHLECVHVSLGSFHNKDCLYFNTLIKNICHTAGVNDESAGSLLDRGFASTAL